MNPTILSHRFLAEMYGDAYFPDALVDRVRQVLLDLSAQIEANLPPDTAALLVLTHAATEQINALQLVFEQHGSEIETVARDCIGMDFDFVARTHGFDVDCENLIAPREW
ncbi:MAG: putative caspase-like protein [Myxococcota bacterium]|jgi:uncharacterized caspase-like protein